MERDTKISTTLVWYINTKLSQIDKLLLVQVPCRIFSILANVLGNVVTLRITGRFTSKLLVLPGGNHRFRWLSLAKAQQSTTMIYRYMHTRW